MKYIFLFLSLCLSLCLFAQNAAPGLWLENLEELAAEGDGLAWDEDDLEELDFRLQAPLDLNTATRRQLEQLPFLSEGQVENILAYLYIHGPMKSLYELQLVEGMDRRTLHQLQPFVRVDTAYGGRPKRFPVLKDVLKHGRHEALGRLDVPFYKRKGYERDYLGPALYHSLRYSFRYGDYVQAGVTGEKDAGEPFLALHDRKGYDHYSYYLLLRHLGRLETLALGTYRLDYGQGLVLGNGFGLGKSFSLATSRYREGGIRKHGSTDEYNYFRGVAAQVRVAGDVHASAFYSHRRLDGVVEDGRIVSIYETGLHRTQAEADKAHAFAFQVAGGNLTYENNRRALRVGLTGVYYFFDRPYRPNLRPYARYNLQGNHFYNVGLNYRYRLGRFALAGEGALGKRGYALLNRLEYDVAQGYRLLLVHRLYTHDYWAMFARAFGEGSSPQNENGWYVAAEAEPWARWRLFASLDFFSFPWWRYRISKPSQGWEGRFQATWTPGGAFGMYANYRYKRRGARRDGHGRRGHPAHPPPQGALAGGLASCRRLAVVHDGRLQSFPLARPSGQPGVAVHAAGGVCVAGVPVHRLCARHVFPYGRLRRARVCLRERPALHVLHPFVFGARVPLVGPCALRPQPVVHPPCQAGPDGVHRPPGDRFGQGFDSRQQKDGLQMQLRMKF